MIIDYNQIPQFIEANLDIKSAKGMLNSSKMRVNSIGTSFIPEVALYANAEDSRIRKISKEPSAGIFAELNLFNGFRDVEKNKIDQLNYDGQKLELKKSYNQLVLEAQKNFLEAIKLQENMKILNEYEKINQSNKNLILRKVASGLSPRSEELIFKKIELELKEDLVRAENELKIVYSNLKSLFAFGREEKIELTGNLDITKYTYTVGAKKIDLSIVESEESILKAEKKMNSLWRMPKVNFYAEQSFTDHRNGEFLEKDDEKNKVVGLKLTMPLVSGKNYDPIEDQIKTIELESALLRKKRQLLDNESSEEKIEIRLSHLKNMIDLSKNKVELSKEILDKTFSEFKIGLKEALSLNEATVAYVEAKKDLIEHQFDYILSIEEAKGSLLDTK